MRMSSVRKIGKIVVVVVILGFIVLVWSYLDRKGKKEPEDVEVELVRPSYNRHKMSREDYRRVIEFVDRKNKFGFADVLLALREKESGGKVSAFVVGDQGELGPWQIKREHFDTFKKESSEYHDPFDPIDNCELAGYLLQRNLKDTKSWEEAVILYCAGSDDLKKYREGGYFALSKDVKDKLEIFTVCHKKAKDVFPSDLEITFKPPPTFATAKDVSAVVAKVDAKQAKRVGKLRKASQKAFADKREKVDSLKQEMALLKKEVEPTQEFAKAFEGVKLLPDDFSSGPVILDATDKQQLAEKALREKEELAKRLAEIQKESDERLALGEVSSKAMQESVKALEKTIEESILAQDEITSDLKSIGAAVPEIERDVEVPFGRIKLYRLGKD